MASDLLLCEEFLLIAYDERKGRAGGVDAAVGQTMQSIQLAVIAAAVTAANSSAGGGDGGGGS